METKCAAASREEQKKPGDRAHENQHKGTSEREHWAHNFSFTLP